MLGSLILYLKGMRIMMFQLSGFYYRVPLKGFLQGSLGILGIPLKGSILGGSWDLVSTVISTLIGVISNYKYGYLSYNPSY